MSDSQPIRYEAICCREVLKKSSNFSRLSEDGWAENRLIDFNLWAAGAGVSARGRLSLDDRLALNPVIRDGVLNLLFLFKILLEACISQAQTYGHGAKSIESRSGVDVAVTSDDNQESSFELALPELEARKKVEITLDQIIRLTVAIRKAGSGARLRRADRSFDTQSPHTQDLKKFLEIIIPPKGLKEEDQIGEIQSRLIDANLRRHHRFYYARKHSEKLAKDDQELQVTETTIIERQTPESSLEAIPSAPDTDPEDEGHIQVEAQHKPKKPIQAAVPPTVTTAASALEGSVVLEQKATQSATTVISRISSKVAYPRPPRIDPGNTAFVCPCCCQTLPSDFLERSKWKKHLTGDILPYTCVLPDCEQPLELYFTREEWQDHMTNKKHRRFWSCFVCGQLGKISTFDEESKIIDHLTAAHEDTVNKDELQMFADASLKPIRLTACPICPGAKSDEDLLDHVAMCVHTFSLYSLPTCPTEDEHDGFFAFDSEEEDSEDVTPSWISGERDMEGIAELDEELLRSTDEKNYLSHSTNSFSTARFLNPSMSPTVSPSGKPLTDSLLKSMAEVATQGFTQRIVRWLQIQNLEDEGQAVIEGKGNTLQGGWGLNILTWLMKSSAETETSDGSVSDGGDEILDRGDELVHSNLIFYDNPGLRKRDSNDSLETELGGYAGRHANEVHVHYGDRQSRAIITTSGLKLQNSHLDRSSPNSRNVNEFEIPKITMDGRSSSSGEPKNDERTLSFDPPKSAKERGAEFSKGHIFELKNDFWRIKSFLFDSGLQEWVYVCEMLSERADAIPSIKTFRESLVAAETYREFSSRFKV